MNPLLVGSLFMGIAGFDLGLSRAGMQTVWGAEIDPHCRQVCERHGYGPIYKDVRDVKKETVQPVDLICGGFPCQDVSMAGRRAGLAGEHSGLWFEFHRVITELKPGWVIIENVPGLLSSNSGKDFAVILRGLAECGYGIAWRILDAQYFGLAQRRKRVFIVGSLGNGCAAQVLFESEGRAWDTPPSRETGTDIANTIATGTNAARYNSTGGETFAISEIAGYKPGIGTLRANGGDLGGGSEMLVAGTSPSVRRLTPTECERLQGFPDGWTNDPPQTDSTRYRQLGNAVAVPVIEWIGRRLLQKMESK